MNKRSGIESKQKIMKAAMDVFSRKGYAKANIREIARIAGISIGGVYLYFRNKEELYRNLINERMLDIGNKTETIAGKSQSASEALSHFLSLHVENALKHKEFILLHIREHGFTFGVQEKKNFFRKQRELVERLIQRGIRTGEFRKCNADDMAKVIMGSLRGVILSMALDDDVHITPQMMNEFIFNGLLTPARK
ncbi:MAG: TetR/AcrR family transcriptional regulator [Thermodesulfovibrionales bacterium]|nr:TetR/AcrR family transcriptional regulator [Thermodesulfovibrionales bacterium]